MKTISVSTDVFSMIWGLRQPPEESESEILQRVLREKSLSDPLSNAAVGRAKDPVVEGRSMKHAKWWEIIAQALLNLGGKASLAKIYAETTRLARVSGRPIPKEIESVVRGTLEDNCADSERHKHVRNVFYMPEGRGAGVWALRT